MEPFCSESIGEFYVLLVDVYWVDYTLFKDQSITEGTYNSAIKKIAEKGDLVDKATIEYYDSSFFNEDGHIMSLKKEEYTKVLGGLNAK